MPDWYVGIDPGATGAIAFYAPASGELVVHDAPVYKIGTRTRLDVHTLALILNNAGVRRVLIEDVHALPNQGVTSMFSFGFAFGAVQAAVATLMLPFELVTPQRWKKLYGLTADKDAARRMACRELPQYAPLWRLKKHHGRAEAALLALLCAKGLLERRSR